MASSLNIHLRPVWRFRNGEERELDATLLALLEGIEHSGKLTAAARSAGISHRHAWNLIERWSEFLGAPIVVIERGRGTRLSAFGAKLLWAGHRAQARLAPELESLAAELAESLYEPAAAHAPVLRLHASHDFTLAGLRQLAGRSRRLALDLRYRGSAEALAALREERCDVAGFHVTDGRLGAAAASRYAESLGDSHCLVWLAMRVQGLVVAPGNPKSILGVPDLARPGVRFVNRQRDSGTRILLDQLLAQAGVPAAALAGYASEEHTHTAVAAHVAAGLADVGLGILAAARQFHLGFVPLVAERYFLGLHKDLLASPEGEYLLGLIRSDDFHDIVSEFYGEGAHSTGHVSRLRDTPPWNGLL
ncbi:MAG TPA: substrate-binding domain-containing protein [Burkholderiales bacterium]|nr:substrate-binding domain-containing protein [Burkholderiales bacterium]